MEEAEDEYVPEEQSEHTTDEAIEYEPASQAPETAVRPVVAQYEPAVHDEQLEKPVDD